MNLLHSETKMSETDYNGLPFFFLIVSFFSPWLDLALVFHSLLTSNVWPSRGENTCCRGNGMYSMFKHKTNKKIMAKKECSTIIVFISIMLLNISKALQIPAVFWCTAPVLMQTIILKKFQAKHYSIVPGNYSKIILDLKSLCIVIAKLWHASFTLAPPIPKPSIGF